MAGEWIPDYFELWNKHDHDAIAAHFAEDALYDDIGLNQSWRGREAIRAISEYTETGLSSDYGARLIRSGQDGEVWVAEWEFHGTHDNGTAERPATGTSFMIRILTVGTVDADGLITLKRDYYDPTETRRMLGLDSA